MKNDELKRNLTSGSQWVRLLYMVLFAICLEIAGFVLLAVVVLQFLFSIINGSANDNLRRLGDQLASYVYQAIQFLIYNTEEKPFPFSEWPESDVEDLSGYEGAEEVSAEVVSKKGKGGTAKKAAQTEEEAEDAIILGTDESVKQPKSGLAKDRADEPPAAKSDEPGESGERAGKA
ncbi:DUF4389 domain-containing protein [Microbulbifer spongiae]|uniref:DUF4389 domain-containing protein n=1 Tax=Microbulbifer spongiae TaxID=2944933 RepID=A0ABY9EFM4_9GAMM|nr:DUF4389 domain-containing protein [Microbulbifer sp. MI-G]WKD51062.1 DUF4389 domain-containing protein [Microbulbifer sp. MI-G]